MVKVCPAFRYKRLNLVSGLAYAIPYRVTEGSDIVSYNIQRKYMCRSNRERTNSEGVTTLYLNFSLISTPSDIVRLCRITVATHERQIPVPIYHHRSSSPATSVPTPVPDCNPSLGSSADDIRADCGLPCSGVLRLV